MVTKTIAVLGAGPGIGMAVARQFGRQGFRVGLVARNAEKLDRFVTELAGLGIEAAAFPADVGDATQSQGALRAIRARLGTIDVLQFGPTPESATLVQPRLITPEKVQPILSRIVSGAIVAVNEVLPDMLARKNGALLFTGAVSAIHPVLFSANYAMCAAALRNYAESLYVDLARDGIYAGHATIAGLIGEGNTERNKNLAAGARRPGDVGWEEYRAFHEDLAMHIPAAAVSDALWDMYVRRDREETVIGDPDICLRMRANALKAKPAS